MVARKVKGRNHRSADAVADYFLLKVRIEAEDLISNLKMQKLCYLAQGWSLALRDKSLFDDVIQAWALGPAIPPLFRRFKPYRWGALNPYKRRSEALKELDAEERRLLDWVWEEYRHYSGGELRDLICEQAPWKEAYGDTDFPDRCEEEITPASMKAYFLALAKKSRGSAVKGAKSAAARAAAKRVIRERAAERVAA